MNMMMNRHECFTLGAGTALFSFKFTYADLALFFTQTFELSTKSRYELSK